MLLLLILAVRKLPVYTVQYLPINLATRANILDLVAIFLCQLSLDNNFHHMVIDNSPAVLRSVDKAMGTNLVY